MPLVMNTIVVCYHGTTPLLTYLGLKKAASMLISGIASSILQKCSVLAMEGLLTEADVVVLLGVSVAPTVGIGDKQWGDKVFLGYLGGFIWSKLKMSGQAIVLVEEM
jgi:hypothetical protein